MTKPTLTELLDLLKPGNPFQGAVKRVAAITDRDLGRHARKAAQIMEERGVAVGVLEDGNGRVCSVGAFHRATSPIKPAQQNALRTALDQRFANWLCENHPSDCVAVTTPMWHDSVLKDEAPLWLRKFADALDPQ